MDTRAASGLGGGVFLTVIGAILYYAVETAVEGININTVGAILMIAGVALIGLGIISALSASRGTRVRTHDEERVTPDGGVVRDQERIVN